MMERAEEHSELEEFETNEGQQVEDGRDANKRLAPSVQNSSAYG